MYNKYLDCEIKTTITQDRFRKCYYELSEGHWNRILQASVILAASGISPIGRLVENEGEERRCIEYSIISQ